MKVLGAELQAFYMEWPMGDAWFHDEGSFDSDESGALIGVDPAKKYDLEDAIGIVLWQGKGDRLSHIEIRGKRVAVDQASFHASLDLPQAFRAWKSTTTTFIVTLEAAHEAALREFVAGLGGKVAR